MAAKYFNDLLTQYTAEANSYAGQFGLDPLSHTGGERDAFRHAYASAAMTMDYGSGAANVFQFGIAA